MAKQHDAIFAELRRQQIVSLINERGKANVNELCEHFSVSPATIRNDLSELESAGAIRRTHGGAISILGRASYEPTNFEKEVRNVREKRAIAKAAMKFVNPGDAIAVDTGTTTMEFSKELTSVSGLTVVTNDLMIASYLEGSNVNTIMLGGTVRKNFHCTTGKNVVDMLDTLHIDTVFLATNGINVQRGLSTPNLEMASIKSKMIDIAAQSILLADSSKVGTDAFAFFADLKRIDVLITDSHISGELRQAADELGIRIVIADAED